MLLPNETLCYAPPTRDAQSHTIMARSPPFSSTDQGRGRSGCLAHNQFGRQYLGFHALPALNQLKQHVHGTLAQAIAGLTGEGYLYFYDAMAPIVTSDSISDDMVFRGSRYGRGNGDYINCALDEEQYHGFVDELLKAETITLRDFEREDEKFFEACLPVEVIAGRGREALARECR